MKDARPFLKAKPVLLHTETTNQMTVLTLFLLVASLGDLSSSCRRVKLHFLISRLLLNWWVFATFVESSFGRDGRPLEPAFYMRTPAYFNLIYVSSLIEVLKLIFILARGIGELQIL